MDVSNKKPLNDVWIYDTVTKRWLEIKPPVKMQSTGKNKKKEFEPRMAHSAVQYN